VSARSAFIRWAVIGAVAAAILLWAQSEAVGGVEGLLQVGETSDVRPLIESQLGEVPLALGPGHDGQIYYAIGLDLSGDEVGPLLDHAGYRYRRILYPLLASGFGLLEGTPLLVGMIVITIASTAVAAGATAAIGTHAGIGEWAALAVLLNPGVWLSVRLLTSDTLALALMMVGLITLGLKLAWPAVGFALSTLAKDVFVVTPLGLGVSRDRKRWVLAAVSLLVLLAWMTWLTVTFGDGFTGRGNVALPFVGIVDGSANWPNLDVEELVYLGFGLVTVLAGLIVGITRRSWLRWPILGWTALALVSSNWVWDFGNNAARAFAPLAVLVVLSFGPKADPVPETAQTAAAAGEPSGSATL
jgi:hypothetical protein